METVFAYLKINNIEGEVALVLNFQVRGKSKNTPFSGAGRMKRQLEFSLILRALEAWCLSLLDDH
jgi:hypothetical protein